MAALRSKEDLIRMTKDLIARLGASGYEEISRELQEGLSAVDGVREGWTQLQEAIEKVQYQDGSALDPEDSEQLEILRQSVNDSLNRL